MAFDFSLLTSAIVRTAPAMKRRFDQAHSGVRIAGPGLGIALIGSLSAVPAIAQNQDPLLFYEQGGLSYDLSLRPRELTLGTGMLIAKGATSGFERGALKFGPRKAWERAAISRLSYGNVTGTGFFLDPNELPSTEGNNALAGFDLRYDDPRGGYLGAREWSQTLGVYGKTNLFEGALTLAVQVKPTRQDTQTLRYAHIRANELNSPVQFGQATRVNVNGNVVSGVTDAHLAGDLFLEYSRIINRNTFLTAGVSVSFPGAGIDNVTGGSADPWTGGFVNVVVNS
jgi:hypothetical protein